MPRLTQLCLAVLLLGVWPAPAAAVRVGLELKPGVGLPVGPFPSGVPVSISDPDGEILADLLGATRDSAMNLLLDLYPTAAFNFSAALLLNNFTLRVSFSYQRFAHVRITDLAISRVNGQDLPEPLPNIYLKNLLGLQINDEAVAVDNSPSLLSTRISLGYRFYLLDSRLRPYVPLGLGPAFVLIDGEPFYGFHLHGGAGLEYRVASWLDLGVAVEYEWQGIALPETFQSRTAPQSITGQVSQGRSVLGGFLKSAHTIQLGVTSTFRF